MGRSAVLRSWPRGMTIGRLMMVSVVVALSLWLFRARYLSRIELFGWIVIGIAIVARTLVVALYSKHCPVCDKGPVARVATVSFGDHFFRCSACGQRMKRYGLGRLWDASGPEDDCRFHKTRPVSTWSDGPIVPITDSPETLTVGTLLRGKVDREALAPEPVAIAVGEAGWSGEDPRATSARPRATRRALVGVKQKVTHSFFCTLDAIRWARNSQP
ncbi:MAG: hypothetical protein JWN86_2118 [Planctomycetota bacterium]|nr:hypothetical protein [Planctomycetota bacterium]